MNDEHDFLEGKPRWRGSLILLVILAIPFIGIWLSLELPIRSPTALILGLYAVFFALLFGYFEIARWKKRNR